MYGTLPDLLIAVLRHMLTFIAGIIVARGWISAEIATQLVGSLIGLIGVAFSAFFHAGSNGTIPTHSTTPNMASKSASDKPAQITTTTETVSNIPGTAMSTSSVSDNKSDRKPDENYLIP